MGTVNSTRQSVASGVAQANSATPDYRTGQVGRATRLRYELASAGGSWGREFRLLLTLADGRGVSLDADALAFYDVRDLQTLQQRIVTMNASRSRQGMGS